MLIVQLLVGILLATTGGLSVWLLGFGLSIAVLAYVTGGMIGFVLSGLYMRGMRRVKVGQRAKPISGRTDPI